MYNEFRSVNIFPAVLQAKIDDSYLGRETFPSFSKTSLVVWISVVLCRASTSVLAAKRREY